LDCLACVALSALPAVEVRGSVPCLALAGCGAHYAALSYLLSSSTGALVYLLLEKLFPLVEEFLKGRWELGAKLLEKVVERTKKKASKKVEEMGTLGLAAFVALPVPGTGVWTGALAGYLLGLKRRDVVLALFAGNAVTTAIMSLSYLLQSP